MGLSFLRPVICEMECKHNFMTSLTCSNDVCTVVPEICNSFCIVSGVYFLN